MLRDAPGAVVPLAIQGLLAAVLVIAGAFPGTGAAGASGAVFPLDVYFDVKQALAYSAGWAWFAAAISVSVLCRSAVLATTLWLRHGRRPSLTRAWFRCLRLTALAPLLLLPSASFFFLGVAIRYAPFIWIGALAGVVPSIYLARRAAALDVGEGAPAGQGVPEIGTFLGYILVVTLLSAAMSVLGGSGRWATALLLACAGPLHALYLLGWRSHLEQETYPAGGTLAVALTVLAIVGLSAATIFDRYIREPAPAGPARAEGTLLILGGADSTSTTGALSDVDPRDFGFDPATRIVLSYAADGRRYGAADTHADLDEIAGVVAEQLEEIDGPTSLLGHSQAAGIADRMIEAGRGPDRTVVLAPPPSLPPPVEIPPPGHRGEGKVAGDVGRVIASALSGLGLESFDVDAPSAPPHLRSVRTGRAARLAVWALGDSVWLQEDWRRSGEVNVVGISDHVGVTNDERAVAAARRFFSGQPVASDSASWRGALAAALRYTFEPWRPQ